MADEIDRDQAFNEMSLDALIASARLKPTYSISCYYCQLCGEPVPEKRRQTLPGVSTCICCQTEHEKHIRR
ncbi:TPA: TraR/DksA family transcriptional regulator [Citrobacter freundii]|nr:TraR/DksA family transcriptional regulator [Citrobacter freundii]